jgi:hypothetical protein
MNETDTNARPLCHITRYPCGCIYAAIVDDPTIKGNPRRIAKFIMDEVKFGGTIEQVTVDFVGKSENWCSCCPHGNNPNDKKKQTQQKFPGA